MKKELTIKSIIDSGFKLVEKLEPHLVTPHNEGSTFYQKRGNTNKNEMFVIEIDTKDNVSIKRVRQFSSTGSIEQILNF